MKFELIILRREHIFPMLITSLTGIVVTFILISGVAILRSGLLMVE